MAIKIGKYYITQNNPRELLRERAELINVLNEIREYIEKESFHYAYEDDYDIYLCENELEDLLKILDKVKENENL